MSKMKVEMVLDTPNASQLEAILSHHAEFLIDFDNNKDIVSGISNVSCKLLKDWKEIKKLPKINENEPCTDIAGWLTNDPMEEGTIIAKVRFFKGNSEPTVFYRDEAAKTDPRVQQIIKGLKEGDA